MKHIKEFRLVESSEPEISRKYYPDGSVEHEEWYLNGKRHRVDGPAVIYYRSDGSVEHEWWFLDGNRHRVDGPAEIYYRSDGSVESEWWYLDGKDHRVDGPAWIVYRKDGSVESEEWFLDGARLTKAQWVERTPGLSQEELVKISGTDPDPTVRLAAHRNPKFPEDLEGWAINLDDWT